MRANSEIIKYRIFTTHIAFIFFFSRDYALQIFEPWRFPREGGGRINSYSTEKLIGCCINSIRIIFDNTLREESRTCVSIEYRWVNVALFKQADYNNRLRLNNPSSVSLRTSVCRILIVLFPSLRMYSNIIMAAVKIWTDRGARINQK